MCLLACMIYSIHTKKVLTHTFSSLFLWLTSVKDDLHFNRILSGGFKLIKSWELCSRRTAAGWAEGGVGGAGWQAGDWEAKGISLGSLELPQATTTVSTCRRPFITDNKPGVAHCTCQCFHSEAWCVTFNAAIFFAMLEWQMYVSDTKDSWQFEMMSHKHTYDFEQRVSNLA